jgi:hypothetical protein
MSPVRSLRYLLPLVKEVLDRPPGYREIENLAQQLNVRGVAPWPSAHEAPNRLGWSESRGS